MLRVVVLKAEDGFNLYATRAKERAEEAMVVADKRSAVRSMVSFRCFRCFRDRGVVGEPTGMRVEKKGDRRG